MFHLTVYTVNTINTRLPGGHLLLDSHFHMSLLYPFIQIRPPSLLYPSNIFIVTSGTHGLISFLIFPISSLKEI